jgi:hypothetical protein
MARTELRIFHEYGMSPSFAMLACDPDSPAGYVLYIDSPEPDAWICVVYRQL